MTDYSQLLTAREAAQKLGVSYPTMKKWILQGKIRTAKTPGGHHRVPLASIKPYLVGHSTGREKEPLDRQRRISGRNQLAGSIVSIRIEGLMAEVVVAVGESNVTAIITADSVKELELEVGDTAKALIKSTDVMIERLDLE